MHIKSKCPLFLEQYGFELKASETEQVKSQVPRYPFNLFKPVHAVFPHALAFPYGNVAHRNESGPKKGAALYMLFKPYPII